MIQPAEISPLGGQPASPKGNGEPAGTPAALALDAAWNPLHLDLTGEDGDQHEPVHLFVVEWELEHVADGQA